MQVESASRIEMNDIFRKQYPADISICLKFGDCVISVRMNSDELKAHMIEYFKSFVIFASRPNIEITVHEADIPDFPFDFIIKNPDPGKTKIKEEYVDLTDGRIVKKRLTGMNFVFGLGDNLAIGPCIANFNQVINFINNRYIEWKLHQGGLLGHAAGVCFGETGVAMAGFSGMGKSTLALHMLVFGVDFVSNDRLVIMNSDQELTMFGVAKHPRINPGTALNNEYLENLIPDEEKFRYLALSKEDLWYLEKKYDAPVEVYFRNSRFQLSAPMNGLFILSWENENAGPPVFRKVDIAHRHDLLRAFMKETGLFYHSSNGENPVRPTEDDYVQMLSDCDVVEIKGGVDFDKAARFGMDFLKNNGYPG
ncbi:MAG: HprK-related kinase B [Desulfobacteraceae bacterium]|nr:HprK-related kinase B [Desulfobacteraceae bacterium]MBC2754377.1 HprK-related kinase B [Desulfobacteraceae bacterium]